MSIPHTHANRAGHQGSWADVLTDSWHVFDLVISGAGTTSSGGQRAPSILHGKGSAVNLRKEGSGQFILIAYFHPEGLVNWPSDGPAWMGAQKDLQFQGPASHSACEN